MLRKFILPVIFAVSALPAYAGQGTIEETDTQIIIEYSGGEDDVKAAQERKEEVQKQQQEEISTAERKTREDEEKARLDAARLEKAVRKGDKRKSVYENRE